MNGGGDAEVEYTRIVHTIPPVFNSESEILILGSLPSVKSRENNFFYGHPQNRFWKVIAALAGSFVPETIEGKKKLLIENRIALWDVIAECDIIGSSDSSIKNVVPNNLEVILETANIEKIFANGSTAYRPVSYTHLMKRFLIKGNRLIFRRKKALKCLKRGAWLLIILM